MQISNVGNVSGLTDKLVKGSNNNDKTSSFSSILNDALNKVNDLQLESDKVTNSFINGENDNIHNVMLTSSKANLALQMTIQVRNKVMDAYNEIMNMQV